MKPTEFLQSVDSLYKEVEKWCTAKGLNLTRHSLELNEEAYAPYTIEKLSILGGDTKIIAELVPKGGSIIGAKGRIDLVGNIDSAIFVDWDRGGPRITTTIDDGASKHTKTVPVYRNVGEAGWYWVESRKLARAHRLDETLFFDLLSSVSDYEQSK